MAGTQRELSRTGAVRDSSALQSTVGGAKRKELVDVDADADVDLDEDEDEDEAVVSGVPAHPVTVMASMFSQSPGRHWLGFRAASCIGWLAYLTHFVACSEPVDETRARLDDGSICLHLARKAALSRACQEDHD